MIVKTSIWNIEFAFSVFLMNILIYSLKTLEKSSSLLSVCARCGSFCLFEFGDKIAIVNMS